MENNEKLTNEQKVILDYLNEQCRAACNAEPKRYNDIVSLVKRSMDLKTIKYAA